MPTMNEELLAKMSIADLKAALDHATDLWVYYEGVYGTKEDEWRLAANKLEDALEERIIGLFNPSFFTEIELK